MNRPVVIRIAEEFLLINMPILLYVLVESHHREMSFWVGVVTSPEWCIGTAVMSFQAIRLYVYGTSGGPKKSPGVIVALLLFACLVTALAFYLLSMHVHTDANIRLKWATFAGATLFFLIFGGAGLWGEEEYGGD